MIFFYINPPSGDGKNQREESLCMKKEREQRRRRDARAIA
jgi:hypothetical protein